MTFSKIIAVHLMAVTLITVACTATRAESKLSAASQTPTYIKPGASIRYSHTLQKDISPGASTSFTLTLSEDYDAGNMVVNLNTDGDVSLFASSSRASFDMSQDSDHEMQVSFTANSNGRHYINVQALAVDPGGQSMPRIFSIPVQVGPVTAQKPNADMKIMPDGEKIIEMDAQEEIK